MRLLLADDDRQRYSAWYKDYGTLQVQAQDGALVEQQTTRSQQLLSLSAQNSQLVVPTIAPIVDLQIALITPLPIAVKTMQVRLTRRNQCSELKAVFSGSQVSPAGSSSSSMLSYASSATASSASGLASHYYYLPSSILILIVTLLIALSTKKRTE